MTTAVQICSNALLMLGDAPIADFNEDTDKARLASNLFPSVRDFVLRRHPWNCAIKRVVLAPDATPPEYEFNQQFSLPGDFLRVLSIGEHGERPRYRIEGRKLLMDGNSLKLRYIWRNENPATWDAMLIWAMTMVMRGVFAYPVTDSGSLEQLIENILRDILRQARAVDGQEDEAEAMDDAPLFDARFIGSGTSRYRGWA